MHARKVLEMGGGTLLVSIPKDWARKNGIKKGSTLALDELSGRKLIVRPLEDVTEKPKEVVIEYPKEDFTHVLNDVTGAYLFGYGSIRIQGTKAMTREERARLKATMGRLIGLEIMDEHPGQVTIQFLLEPASINPEKIVRRMAGIIEGMVKDTAEGILRSDSELLTLVGERDDEIDRLYFLLVRIVRMATISMEVAEGYGLAPVDVLDYRVLASFLESVGDAVAELSKKLRGSSLASPFAKEYSACLAKLNRMADLSVQAFLTRRTGRSRKTYLDVKLLSDEIEEQLGKLGGRPEAELSASGDSLGTIERISRLLADISDLAVPTQPAG